VILNVKAPQEFHACQQCVSGSHLGSDTWGIFTFDNHRENAVAQFDLPVWLARLDQVKAELKRTTVPAHGEDGFARASLCQQWLSGGSAIPSKRLS
jgi:hypothetical protein